MGIAGAVFLRPDALRVTKPVVSRAPKRHLLTYCAVTVLQAVEQMEERLSQFIESNHLEELDTELDGAARFVQHQVVELARDCLAKSISKHISTSYFCELSDNLQQLLHDVSMLSMFG